MGMLQYKLPEARWHYGDALQK